MSKKHLLLILLVILLASAIRLYDPIFRSLWGDEGHSLYNALNISGNSLKNAINSLLMDTHLPSYFVALSVWINIFGISEYALRSLSVIFGILCVAIFYLFARELFEVKVALVSTFLLALSPLAVMHSQEIRMYSLLLLSCLLSSYFFWKLLSGKTGFLNILGYITFTALLLLTHIFSVLVVLSQFIFMLIDLKRTKDRSGFFLLVSLQAIVCLFILPFYMKIIITGLPAAMSGVVDMAFSSFPSCIKPFLFLFVLTLGETVAPWNLLFVLPAMAIFGALFLRTFGWLSDSRISYLMTSCLFPILFSAIFLRPTMPKYLIISLPFYLLLIGYSLMQVRSRALLYGLVLCLAIVQLFSVNNYYHLREFHNSNQIEPWRQVAGQIKDGFHKGDIILASDRYIVFQLLEYYLNGVSGSIYPIYSLQGAGLAHYAYEGNDPLYFGRKVKAGRIGELRYERIWFITHILDDRIFPKGYIAQVRSKMNFRYALRSEYKFVPYEETLASKLPIKRHEPGSARISVSLYVREK